MRLLILSGVILLFTFTNFCFSQTKLSAGDKIEVRIPIEPHLGGELTIDREGMLYFPVVEQLDLPPIKVEGLTIDEARMEIEKVLRKYYVDPKVTVRLITPGYKAEIVRGVSIFGAVGSPNVYPFREGMRLLDLLLLAGNVTEEADISSVTIFRNEKEFFKLSIGKLLQGEELEKNILLNEGDFVIVPSIKPKGKIKVNLFGKVASPGTLYLSEDSRVFDAIAAAGGPFGRAAVGKILVLRVENNIPVTIFVDMKSAMKRGDLSQNIPLKSDDIIFVPETERPDVMKIIDQLFDWETLREMLTD